VVSTCRSGILLPRNSKLFSPQVGLIEFLAIKPQRSGVMGLNTEHYSGSRGLVAQTRLITAPG